jgi:hypothetical protein
MAIQSSNFEQFSSQSLVETSFVKHPNNRRVLNRSISAPRLGMSAIQSAAAETAALISSFSKMNLSDSGNVAPSSSKIVKSTSAIHEGRALVKRTESGHRRTRANFQDYDLTAIRNRRESLSSESEIDKTKSGSSEESGSVEDVKPTLLTHLTQSSRKALKHLLDKSKKSCSNFWKKSWTRSFSISTQTT